MLAENIEALAAEGVRGFYGESSLETGAGEDFVARTGLEPAPLTPFEPYTRAYDLPTRTILDAPIS